jgi:hypothetical protein
LALSAGTNQNYYRVDGCVEDGAAKPLDVSEAASSTRRNACCPPAHTVELVTEFGGLKSLPSMRFLVTTPVCWKTLDARIKGAERGYMEAYSREEVGSRRLAVESRRAWRERTRTVFVGPGK